MARANLFCRALTFSSRASRCCYYSAFACESQSSWSWIFKCHCCGSMGLITNSSYHLPSAEAISLFKSYLGEFIINMHNKVYWLSLLILTTIQLNRNKYYYPLFVKDDETGSKKHTVRYQHLDPCLLSHDKCHSRNSTEKKMWAAGRAGGHWASSCFYPVFLWLKPSCKKDLLLLSSMC